MGVGGAVDGASPAVERSLSCAASPAVERSLSGQTSRGGVVDGASVGALRARWMRAAVGARWRG